MAAPPGAGHFKKWQMQSVNLMSVVLDAVLGWLFGALWFQPFAFGPTWQKLLRPEDQKIGTKKGAGLDTRYLPRHRVRAGLVREGAPSFHAADGALQGFLIGACFAATNGSVMTLFRAEPFTVFFIEYGGQVATMALMGAIVGIWA